MAALARTFGRWQRRIQVRRRVQATVRALSGLDDRTLHDLGLGRSEAFSVALEAERAGRSARRRGLTV
jgi:uncharacterized protein YjiS (DUF1127 family)